MHAVHPQRFLLGVATFVPPALFHKTEENLQHTDKRVTGRLFLIALEASDAANYKNRNFSGKDPKFFPFIPNHNSPRRVNFSA